LTVERHARILPRIVSDPSRIVVAEGAWAAEAILLDEIERRLPHGAIPPAPLVVLVPSRSLREHLLGRLASRRGAWLGLEVTTLAALVGKILAGGGTSPPSGEALFPMLQRRLAAREPALATPLGPLSDGYDEIGGAVRDLLDAGFVEEHLEAVEERLDAERASAGTAAVERGVAIARVAAGVRRELAALGLALPADRFARAASLLSTDPEAALRCTAVLVHGFADLTGVGTDFLATLVRYRPTTLVFDVPPDLDGRPRDWRFGRRLRERLAGLAPVERPDRGPHERPATPPQAFSAADPAREAAAAVGWLAEAGELEELETHGLVARDLTVDLGEWARQLDRQGLPFTAETGPSPALTRRVAGIVELMTRGADTPLGVALSVAVERLEASCGASLADLRLGFALVGARNLGAATQISPPKSAQKLPIADRIGFAEGTEKTGEAGELISRELAPAALAEAIELLTTILGGLRAMAAPQPIAARLAHLRGWLERLLPAADVEDLGRQVESLGDPALADVEVDSEEWRRLLETAWSEALARPLGAGGGVALLSVTGARGRTFDRLALVGLTRDRFPRSVRADPLLPDALRTRLRELLPDLPIKSEGHDEERFLFAQLVASASELALFRSLADGQGRVLSPSPLLDELLRHHRSAVRPAPSPTRRCALDVAIGSALAGPLDELAPSLASAADEARSRFGDRSTVPARALAAARVELLWRRSADPSRHDATRLGPYLGAVGRPAARDPRHRDPWVTALERLAGCGWRFFLENLLRLAPLPELVETLPSLPGRLVGKVVHDVLEQMLPAARGLLLAEARTRTPSDTIWPAPELLAGRLRAAARNQLVEAGLDPALFEATLVREAEAFLATARARDWPAGHRDLLAVETNGVAEITAAGTIRRIRFRVDRVELHGAELRFTDYKTGRPLSTGVRESTRARHLAARIASGEALQLPIYLLGGAAAGAHYLYLDPELDDRVRELALAPDELDAAALTAALDALFAARDAGSFVPRLLERDLRDPYSGCTHCEVREACLQGDSAARRRLARWAAAGPSDANWDRAARRWWELRPPARRASSGASS